MWESDGLIPGTGAYRETGAPYSYSDAEITIRCEPSVTPLAGWFAEGSFVGARRRTAAVSESLIVKSLCRVIAQAKGGPGRLTSGCSELCDSSMIATEIFLEFFYRAPLLLDSGHMLRSGPMFGPGNPVRDFQAIGKPLRLFLPQSDPGVLVPFDFIIVDRPVALSGRRPTLERAARLVSRPRPKLLPGQQEDHLASDYICSLREKSTDGQSADRRL